MEITRLVYGFVLNVNTIMTMKIFVNNEFVYMDVVKNNQFFKSTIIDLTKELIHTKSATDETYSVIVLPEKLNQWEAFTISGIQTISEYNEGDNHYLVRDFSISSGVSMGSDEGRVLRYTHCRIDQLEKFIASDSTYSRL